METPLKKPLKQCVWAAKRKDIDGNTIYYCRILVNVGSCKRQVNNKPHLCTFYETKEEFETRQKEFERKES